MHLLTLFLSLSVQGCDMSCRMGCDTFNGLSDCYTYCGCTFMYSPIPISSDLKESVAKYQLSIYLSLHCADDYLSLCTGTSLEQVECLKQNGCMIEEATSLMSEVPKELWIAVQPSAIHYVVAAEQLEKYENYQQCATYCYELCVNSKDSSETCSQNCMLQFCYSYDYTSGGYYESQIAEKKAEESYPDYDAASSSGIFACMAGVVVMSGLAYWKIKN